MKIMKEDEHKKELLEAVKQYCISLEYPCYIVRQNYLYLLDNNKKLLAELLTDRDFVLKVVKQKGYALQLASEELRGDREVVLTAVKQNHLALKFASKELQNDNEIVFEAMKNQFIKNLK